MKTKIISFFTVFMFVFLCGSVVNANASGNLEELKDLAEKYDGEILDSNVIEISNEKPLVFEDVEDFELFLEENKENNKISTTEEIFVGKAISNGKSNTLSTSSTLYSGYIERSWWGPMNGPVMGVLSFRNMSFNTSVALK